MKLTVPDSTMCFYMQKANRIVDVPSDTSERISDKGEKIIQRFIDKGKIVSLLIAFFFGLFSLPYAINRIESTNIDLVF